MDAKKIIKTQKQIDKIYDNLYSGYVNAVEKYYTHDDNEKNAIGDLWTQYSDALNAVGDLNQNLGLLILVLKEQIDNRLNAIESRLVLLQNRLDGVKEK